MVYSPHHQGIGKYSPGQLGLGRSGYGSSSGAVNARWDNLLAGWLLDEASDGSGAVPRADVLGVATLTDNNTVTSAVGINGNAANFVLANSESLSVADPFYSASFTLSFWFYTVGTPGAIIYVGKDDAAAQREFYVLQNADTTFQFAGFSGAVETFTVATAAVTSDAWHMATCWLDDTDKILNMSIDDGATVSAVGAMAGSLNNSTAALFLGARNNTSFQNYITGRMDLTYFWSRVLSSAERTSLYNAGAGRKYPD